MSGDARLPSLRAELLRLTTLVALGWLLVLALTVSWAVRHEVNDLLDEALREAAEVMYGVLATASQGSEGAAVLPEVLPAPAHEEKFVWQIVDAQGHVVRRSHKAPRASFSEARRLGWFDQGRAWRVYGIALGGSAPRTLYVAQVGSERSEAAYEALGTVLLAALTVSLIWSLLLRQRVDRTLRPLLDLTRQIEAYDPLNPETEPAGGQRAETAAISEAVRALGGRLAKKVKLERAFSACAAHSLRTPLAGMDAQLALAQREPPGSAPQRLARARAALTRLTRVVQSLLALFRAGEGWGLQRRECRLSVLMAEIPVEGLDVQVQEDVAFVADPDLVTIALVNLLDNAVRFDARHVRLRGVVTEGQVRLQVEDDGTGISQARWEEVLQALGDGDVGTGLGLGLRLAALVAQAHGGQLSLPPPDGERRGFVVVLSLAQGAAAH